MAPTAVPPELVPLCSIEVQLGPVWRVGAGPSGARSIGEITRMDFSGRLSGSLLGAAAADWTTLVDGVFCIDVRATIKTDDGAVVYVQYAGRSDASRGVGSAPMYVAPRFETGHPSYAWLNKIQAVGRGNLTELHYEWYELR